MTFKEYALEQWQYDGLSARTIYDFSIGRGVMRLIYPHDPDDLCRCIQVLRFLLKDDEEAKIKLLALLSKLHRSEHYEALAKNWHELMSIFKEEWDSNYAPKTYDFMKKIYASEER